MVRTRETTRITEVTRLLQVNLNRSWGALELLKQFMIEENIGLGIISEPPRGLSETNTCFVSG